MARDEVTMVKWTCDGQCGCEALTEKMNTLPKGWSESERIKLDLIEFPLTLCPACSENPGEAKIRFENRPHVGTPSDWDP